MHFGGNLGPVIYDRIPEESRVNVNVGEYLDFFAPAQDSDGCALTYIWRLEDHDPVTAAGYRYFPACTDPLTQTLVAYAVDPEGAKDSTQWNISVFKTGGHPGIPTWTAAGGTNWCPGEPVTLTASVSGEPSSWEWSASCGGEFHPPNGNPTVFVPPVTTAPMTCQISVIAQNDCGPSDPGFASGTIYPIPGIPSVTFFPANP